MRTAGWCVLIGGLAIAAGAVIIGDAVRRLPATIDHALADLGTDDDWDDWCNQAEAITRHAPARCTIRPVFGINPPDAPTALDIFCAVRLAPFFDAWDAKVRGRDTTPGPEETP